MDEEGFKLGDLVGALRRRAKVMIAVAGAVFLASVLVAAVLPNQYVASTTLLIEPQTISKKLVSPGVEESDLVNRLHLMTMQILSRARLSKVIDDLNLYPELSDEMTREEVIDYMRGQIWVEPVLPELATESSRRDDVQINTFRLYFRHGKAGTAAAVANRLANDFIDEHIRDRVQVSGDTAEFIEAELSRLAQRLREVEAQIAQVKADNAGSLPEDRAGNELQLQRSLDALRESQRRLAEAESDAAFYKQQATLARTSEADRSNVVGQAVTPALRLRQLEMAMGEYRARGFTDKHPDVVAAQAEMEALRERMEDGGEGGAAMSLAEQEAQAEARRAELRAAGEGQEIERLQALVDQTQTRLAQTPRVAEQLDSLEREYLALSQSFQEYSNKRLEAGVSANMERRQKGEQFRVLEAAVPAGAPASPNRLLILLIGAMLGTALGAAVGIALEATDASFHQARSLQESLRIPVLAAVPAILLPADRRAARRRLMREAALAGVVTMVVLTGSAIGYVVVNRPGLFGSDEAAVPSAPAAPTPPPAAPTAGVGQAG